MWILALIPGANADTWGPFFDGIVSPPRDDAPTDGQILVAANFLPLVTVAEGPDAPFELDPQLLTGVGAPPRVVVPAPPAGYVPGATYRVRVEDIGYDSGLDEITFTVGEGPAPDAGDVTSIDTTVDPWSEPTTYAWGCCEPTRLVQIAAEVPGADPWAYVELVGQFDLGRPSQITTEEIHTHLDLALGPGPHVLSFEQWRDSGPQPPCVLVRPVSASGHPGAAPEVCPGDLGGIDGCGCNSTTPVGLGFLPWLGALAWIRGTRSAAAPSGSTGPPAPPRSG